MAQREFERKEISLDFKISIRVITSSDRNPVTKIIDMSYGGLKILSPLPYKINDLVDLKLEMDDDMLKFIASVKRCEQEAGQYLVGLQFETISKINLKRLYTILK